MKTVDLNCDMGESFGQYTLGNDLACMALISSANIACGFHAGDSATMRATVKAAAAANVAIGAHPGFPDLQGFGRRRMQMSPQEIYDICIHQLGALAGFCRIAGVRLAHVKPHGALSNIASEDAAIARAIAQATFDFDPDLVFLSIAGSQLVTEGKALGLRVVQEVFADRTYQDNGLLTPRTHPKALITDVGQSVAQVLEMVREGRVTTVTGNKVPITAESICVHGDGAHALEFITALRERLEREGVIIAAPYTRRP